MNEFIEKNRGLLRFYCIAARIIGWGLLLMSVVFVIWMLLVGADSFRSFLTIPPYHTGRLGHWHSFARWNEQIDVLSLVVRFVLPGLLALGVAQFIRYLSERDYRPGWILRCAEGILYLYAVLLVTHLIFGNIFSAKTVIPEMGFSTLPITLFPLLVTAAKVTILIGLGQILARVMPLIEESKTLV